MTKEWREANRDKQRDYQMMSRIKHHEANKQRDRERYAANSERWKQYYLDNRDERLQASKEYKKSDKYRKYAREYMAKRLKENPNARLALNLRHRIKRALAVNLKSASMKELVGCTMDELRLHLESQFNANMSWDNYGEWHIDHKIPDSHFTYDKMNDEQFKLAWALDNLQPLWATRVLQRRGSHSG